MHDKNDFLTNSSFFQDFEEDSGDLIPLVTSDEGDEKELGNLPDELPILPLRNTVLFPGMVIPITVGRAKSIRLVKDVYKGNRVIGVVTQKNMQKEDPELKDLFKLGTIAKIIKMLVMPDGNTTIIIRGKARFEMGEEVSREPFFMARYKILKDSFPSETDKELDALMQSIRDSAERILKINPEIPQEAQMALDNIENPMFLIHFLCSNVNADLAEKQKLLEVESVRGRATKLLELMLKDIQMLELKNEIQNKVSTDIDQQQRDYLLRQQMKILQDELGYDSPEKEIEDFRMKGEEKKWSKDVKDHFNKELDKLVRINPASAEYPVMMNYVELLLELPWGEFTLDDLDLENARKILDNDHFGLDKVKDRIIEYLAVLKLKEDLKAPILCFYGPPGVGKTSLGRSIAKALGRKYVRMSLGGIRDEAEIRGHRKTYVGAMPGRVVQNIKKSKSSNPVFVLDEIDKVGADFRGDPSSALLEVLDPEQNETFVDNYLEVEYDLSKILFIATCNSLDTIQPALRDRMEIIEINGYTLEEKLQIAKKHLIPKQREEHGLKAAQMNISKSGLQKIIDGYTRESGVRDLERKIGRIARSLAKKVATSEKYKTTLGPEEIGEILGATPFDRDSYENNDKAGLVTGLAWTRFGGEILTIESIFTPGKGKLTLSGQLGDVMKESAMAALSYIKANAQALGIANEVFEKYDIHLHVPAGAVPKDGPSAGIAMLTALTSLLTQRKVRSRLAMTGEITLSGKVLPVGGIKEKLLAAKRAGIKSLILSRKNEKDIEEIEAHLLKGLEIQLVDHADQVLDFALLKQKVNNAIELK